MTGLVGTFTSLSAGSTSAGSRATVYFGVQGNRQFNETIWRIQTDGTGEQRINPDDTTRQLFPSISPSGRRLLFWQAGPGNPGTLLMEQLADGTKRQLTVETFGFAPVAWTPNELSVIYPEISESGPATNLIRQFQLDNSTKRDLVPDHPGDVLPQLTTGTVHGNPVVIYINDRRGLNLIDLNTGLDTAFFNPPDSDRVNSVDLSRDGRKLVLVLTHAISATDFRSLLRVIDVQHPEMPTNSLFTFPGGGSLTFGNTARWLPDGSGFIVTAVGPPSGYQLHLLDASGHEVRQLTTLPLGVAPGGYTLGPTLSAASQVLIGEDGLLGSSASGIIVGQGQSGGLTTIVGFHSDRPRSVTLKANTGLNSTGPALTFTLTADQLRTLRFINSPPGGAVTTVTDSSSAPIGGAMINFDAANGAVTLVLPFAAGTGSPTMVSESGGTRIFRGNFVGAWQSRTNLAPQGASEVRLESASGKVEVTP
jgi:hypothetical protein